MNSTTFLASAGALLTLPIGLLGTASTPLRWTAQDPDPATRFGAALAPAGDWNGDGLLDLAVGAPHAPNASGTQPSTGRVQILSGRDGSPLQTWAGVSPSSWFGADVDGGFDADGDGISDLLVGAPLGSPASGSVHLYSGADGSHLAEFVGGAPGDRFGASVCWLGDVSGDGTSDLAIGAPHADGGGTNSGEVRVLSGADGSLLYAIEGNAGDFLGTDLARTCDLDADGRPDLLIGAPFSDTTGFNAGSAYVHSGATGARLLTMDGTTPGDWLGSRVANLGDVDGDGHPDFGLGVAGSDLGGFDSGAVEVRSGFDGGLLFAVPGDQAGEYMNTVAGIGDTNGDGHNDLAVGSSSASEGGSEAGRVRIVSGLDGSQLASFRGKSYDWFGASLSGLLSPSGRIDLAIGAPGHDDHTDKLGRVAFYRASRTEPVAGRVEVQAPCQ